MVHKISVFVTLLFAGLSLTGFTIPASRAAEEEGNPWLLWVFVFVALAAFVAFMIWWTRGHSEEEEEEEEQALATPAEQEPAEEAEPEKDAEETAESEPAAPSPEPDDLKKIEGIGPKISSVLQAAGITTFDQLAALDTGRLEQILEEANPNLLRLTKPATWPEQAKLAAAGQWEDLEELQDELHGGHRR